jgi:hypothetical protein
VLHWNGTRWTEQASISGEGLVAISGSAEGGIFAASGTSILRYDGSQWSRVPGPEPATTFVRYAGLWTAPNAVAFLGGGVAPGDTLKPLLARFNGTQWAAMPSSGFGDGWASVMDLSGSSAADVWAIGSAEKCFDCNGTIAVVAHREGPTWTAAFRQTLKNDEYHGIAAFGPSNVWVAGENSEGNAIVVHFDGSTWTTAEPLRTPEYALNDIWGSSGSDIYAVGPGGLLHYDGTEWTKVPGIKGDRVWGPSPADVYVVQATQLVHGKP